ncbi:MAG: LAGLIDADG family homing endonuclease [Methanosarcinaceae archaeon]|nr:LAGLIDADG family homing endonuclease [Methanosarcinaceae archaeon]
MTDAESKWNEKLKKFFKDYYWNEILQLANEYPDQRSLTVDFSDIEKFDRGLSKEFLDKPGELVPAAEAALREIDLPVEKEFDNAHVRLIKVPNRVPVRDLRSKHLTKFISIEGMIRKATEVRPRITKAAFECLRCGHVTFVEQNSFKFEEPFAGCENETCGKKGPFKILIEESSFVDAQKLQIQESPENLKGGSQPQSLEVDAEDDLTGNVSPGDRVIINGILNSRQRILREGKSTFYDLVLETNSIERQDQDFDELEITAEDEEEILKLSRDSEIYEKIIASIAPSIYGYEDIKEALSLQLFSGVVKNLPDGARVRGDIHIMLVGDPGIAKSQLLRYVVKLSPRGVFASGRSASASGLTAAAVKDELNDGRWTIEGGALVMADMGVAAVDEMDKMRTEDKSALHEAMEQQCYDDRTEILTSKGWKFFKDVNKEDLVATLSPAGKLEYAVPEKYVEADYDGELYFVKSRQVDLAVTPNHNMYVNINKRANEWEGFKLNRMDELPVTRRMRFKKNAIWEGKRLEAFEIPPVTKYKNQNCQGHLTDPIKLKMDDWVEFLGYYLSEGSIGKINGIPYKVLISQLNEENCKIIESCIKNLGLKFSYDGINFNIHSKQFAGYLAQFGKCYDKFVPAYVKQLCPEQLQIFLNALVLGDGHIRKTNGQTCYITTSKRLADDVQELLLKTGISGNIYIQKRKGENVCLPGGEEGVLKNNIYLVSFLRKGDGDKNHLDTNHPNINDNGNKHITKDHYSGKIYCVEVPHHVIYVRRNGIPVWCGNTISLAKAGIIATLKSRCALLGAANPKYGRFDRYEGLAEQINMPPALLSRFDLIFVMLDTPNHAFDTKIANHILQSHYAGELFEQREKLPGSEVSEEFVDAELVAIEPAIDAEIMRKYVAYARKNVYPVMEEDAKQHMIEFYTGLRKSGEGKNSPVPVTARQLEALVRLSEASARVRLSNIVTLDDAKRTTRIVLSCMKNVGVDPETGAFDADIIASGTSKSQRDKIKILRDIIKKVSERHPGGKAPLEEVYMEADKEQGINREHAESHIKKMLTKGDLFKPDQNHIKLVN